MRGHRLASKRIVRPGEWHRDWSGTRCVRPALWEIRCECGWKSAPLPMADAHDAHIEHLWPIREERLAAVS